MELVSICVAGVVWVVVAAQSLIAWRAQPGRAAGEEFFRIWQSGPWAKQFYLDFVGLEVVLALFMLSHAAIEGGWLLVTLCIATLPVLGAMSAAFYWIVAVAT